MKKIFTLCVLFILGITAMHADNYVFVDKDGNVYEDGVTITVTEAEEDPFGEGAILRANLFVKNVGAPSDYSVRIHNEITQIDNGQIQVCFPTLCHNYTTAGEVNKSEAAKLAIDESMSIQEEWLATAYGECQVTYTAMALSPMGNLFVEKGGPKVTVRYIYADQTGVKPVVTTSSTAEYYDLQGRTITQPRKGIVIVRMTDGSVHKVISR